MAPARWSPGAGCSTSPTAGATATRPASPVVVVTHQPPPDAAERWPRTTFVDGVEPAIKAAKEIADGKDVTLMSANVTQQALDLGLVDELCVSLVPVLFGEGIPLLRRARRAGTCCSTTPSSVPGRRALHLPVPGPPLTRRDSQTSVRVGLGPWLIEQHSSPHTASWVKRATAVRHLLVVEDLTQVRIDEARSRLARAYEQVTRADEEVLAEALTVSARPAVTVTPWRHPYQRAWPGDRVTTPAPAGS